MSGQKWVGIVFFGFLGLQGCFSNQPERKQAFEVSTQDRPLIFDPAQVDQLILAKSDPDTGDQWMVTLHSKENRWEISSPPNDQVLLDKRANEKIINHLVDELRFLRQREPSISESTKTDDDLGLSPPRYALRIRTSEKEFEVQLGKSLGNGFGCYARLSGPKIWILEGSALKILGQISSFSTLRKRNWASIPADDVDEIELKKQNGLSLYAQREGDRWTNRRHQNVRKDIQTLLTQITAIEAEKLIDDPKTIQKLSQLKYSDTITLSDRFGRKTILQIKKQNHLYYGLNSDRPETAFILDPKVATVF